MADFETHPVGTAALLAELQSAQKYRYIGKNGKPVLARDLEDLIEQLEAEIALKNIHIDMIDTAWDQYHEAITRANAATAAAFEVAAQKVFTDQWPNYGDAKRVSENIRSLATPDQTAALDRLIAEAVWPYLDALIWCSGSADFNEGGFAREGWKTSATPSSPPARKAVRDG